MLLLKESAAVAQTDALLKPLFFMWAIDMIFFKQYGDLEFWFSSQIALTVKVNCWKYLCGNCFENENDKSLNCLWVIFVTQRIVCCSGTHNCWPWACGFRAVCVPGIT